MNNIHVSAKHPPESVASSNHPPHSEVVVALLRELLGTQTEQVYHLPGQVLRRLEPLGVEDHLGDQACTNNTVLTPS